MRIPEVNVLVNAFRSDSEHHLICRDWLEGELNSSSAVGLATTALTSLVRITTHRRIFVEPSTLSEALSFCDYLLDQEAVVPLSPGEHHWEIFKRVCGVAKATGNLVQDGWFAALAIEHGGEWVTLDSDFGKFPELKWRLLKP